jgi:hypothetical protein
VIEIVAYWPYIPFALVALLSAGSVAALFVPWRWDR